MTTAGRRALPANVHLLKGDPSGIGREKLKENASLYPPLQNFEAPEYFSEDEKRYYMEICQRFQCANVVSIMDAMALELLVESYAEWREHKEWLDNNGYLLVESGAADQEKVKAHPFAMLKQNAHKQVVALLREFGWTPSSRSKTANLSKTETDPLGNEGKRPNV